MIPPMAVCRNFAPKWLPWWYVVAFCLITCIVNSINCVWVAVAGLLVPDFIYNIGTTVLNGGISMVIFFFVNKIIFPEGAQAK